MPHPVWYCTLVEIAMAPTVEHVRPVVIHAENKAPVDHHAEVVQPADRLRVVAADVLVLALFLQVLAVDGLEADKQAAET